jgi:hypothetical protein
VAIFLVGLACFVIGVAAGWLVGETAALVNVVVSVKKNPEWWHKFIDGQR